MISYELQIPSEWFVPLNYHISISGGPSISDSMIPTYTRTLLFLLLPQHINEMVSSGIVTIDGIDGQRQKLSEHPNYTIGWCGKFTFENEMDAIKFKLEYM